MEHLFDLVPAHRVEIVRYPQIGTKPSRFGCVTGGAASGTTLTSSLPALAMMKGSPLAARSTSRDRRVLASCILTVRIAWLDLGYLEFSLRCERGGGKIAIFQPGGRLMRPIAILAACLGLL